MLATAGCASLPGLRSEADEADAIYFGGAIRPLTKDGELAIALAVKDGRILRVGNREHVFETRGPKTRLVNLEGRCLMPGFVDAHARLALQAARLTALNLEPKPSGTVASVADISDRLRTWIVDRKIAAGSWVIGWGYDHAAMTDHRHPLREDLDQVSTDHPIVLLHASGALLAGNSRLFAALGVTADTPDPAGGRYLRRGSGREPNGLLEGTAVQTALAAMPAPTPEQAIAALQEALTQCAAAGITTAQDSSIGPGAQALLAQMAAAGKLPIDVVAYAAVDGVDDGRLAAIARDARQPSRLRIAGVALTIDGPAQHYGAYLSQPYATPPGKDDAQAAPGSGAALEHGFISRQTPAGAGPRSIDGKPPFRGASLVAQASVADWIRRCDAQGVQIVVHASGDAAVDDLQTALGTARKDKPRPELRSAIAAAQLLRDDQIRFAAAHGLTPSFCMTDVRFAGDLCRDVVLGAERAARLDPAGASVKQGLRISLSNGAPGIGTRSVITTVHSAVNRYTISTKLLGLEQRLTRFQAMRAVTTDAAWQCFEDQRKGTLEPGKLADMVILSDDPLASPQDKLVLLRVFETIKEGKTVYAANR